MKIFWSWQSDTPGKTGRHLVRDALADAVAELKESPELDEAVREELHLDQDTRGVAGSPDLAQTIMRKISDSEAFVADVTSVGIVNVTVEPKPELGSKRLINSNVALELGYALRALSDKRVLLVFNKHYGRHEDLPFDLRHKGGAIVFELAPGASAADIKAQRKHLTQLLIVALSKILQGGPIKQQPFPEQPIVDNSAVFFSASDTIALYPYHDGELDCVFERSRVAYARLVPSKPRAEDFTRASLKRMASDLPLLPLQAPGTSTSMLNKFGAIRCHVRFDSALTECRIIAATQLFASGEVWSFSSFPFSEQQQAFLRATVPFLPATLLEQIYLDYLPALETFVTTRLDFARPWTIELGVVGLENSYIAVANGPNGLLGPIRIPEVSLRRTVHDSTSSTDLLLSFVNKLYDASGHERPESPLGFPQNRPSPWR
jgi:hypothetical protein